MAKENGNQTLEQVLWKAVDKLRELAIILAERIHQNTTIEWNIKESVRARMKVMVKRLLRQYGYQPDMQALATETVLRRDARAGAHREGRRGDRASCLPARTMSPCP